MNKQFLRELGNPLLLLWYRLVGINVQDTAFFCSQQEKHALIKKTYRARPDIRIFIETGTAQGNTVEFVKKDFARVYSIELSEQYAQKAIRRFSNDPHVTIITGDSKIELPKLLQSINEPCVFWLDGHYSYADTARGDTVTPIIEELKTLLVTPHKHVIIIDDARLFIGRHNYPWLTTLARFVKKTNNNYTLTVACDMIILTPR